MLQVNYRILPKTNYRMKNVATKSKHNSFYDLESHFEPFLTDNHGIFVDDFFGFCFTNEDRKADCTNNREKGSSCS